MKRASPKQRGGLPATGGVAKGRSPRKAQVAGQRGILQQQQQQAQQKPTQQEAQARALAALHAALQPHHAAAQQHVALATDAGCPTAHMPQDDHCSPAAPAHVAESLQQQQQRQLPSPEPLDRLRVSAEEAQRPAAGEPASVPMAAPCGPMKPSVGGPQMDLGGTASATTGPRPEPGSEAWEQAARQAHRSKFVLRLS